MIVQARVIVMLFVAMCMPPAYSSDADTAEAEADAALMARLRTEIEAIPEVDREAKGLKILLDNVDNFKTEVTQRRVYLSVGDLYQKRGELEKAMVYHTMAGVPDVVSNDVGAVSRDRLLDDLEKKGDCATLLTQALQCRDAPGVSDNEYATLTHRAGLALIHLQRTAEAVELVIEAATKRPSEDMYHALETVSTFAGIQNDMNSRAKGMRWLDREAGDFGRSLRFLGNLAHSEEVSGNIAESIRVRRQIVENYPDTEEAAIHLESIVRLLLGEGDKKTARTYAAMMLDGKYPEKYKEYARKVFELCDGKPAVETVVPQGDRRITYVVVLLANAVVLLTLVAYALWARRRHGRR